MQTLTQEYKKVNPRNFSGGVIFLSQIEIVSEIKSCALLLFAVT